MSPRPGGEADKLGNRFETIWTVRQLLEVLHGRADAIELEPDGELGRGAEFLLSRGGRVEAHQVKRQRGVRNGWTLRALGAEGVLAAARAHITAGREFHFVSLIPCRPLHELSEIARSTADARQMGERLSKELGDEFTLLCSDDLWGSPENVHAILAHLRVSWTSEDELLSANAVLAAVLFEGAPPATVAAALGDLLTTCLGRRLDAAEAIGLATGPQYGLRRRRGVASPELGELVAGVTSAWLSGAQATLLEPPIVRSEADELINRLTGEDGRLVVAVGAAGAGKTAVLAQVLKRLQGEGPVSPALPVLAVRLDRLEMAHTTQQLGAQLGLPVSPVAALGAIAKDTPSLLLIDQLDAVSFVSARVPQLLDVVLELLHEMSGFPQMRALLACRRFDLDNDDRLRGLSVSGRVAEEFTIGRLSDDQVTEAITTMGLDGRGLTRSQRDLLRLPLHLVLLSAVVDHTDALVFEAPRDLFERFWKVKRRDCDRRAGRRVRFTEVVSRVAACMSESQRLSVRASIFDHDDLAADAEILASEHVLAWSDHGAVGFFHEAFFDYAFAREWVQRHDDLEALLASADQELFRRAQVRQVLLHLHDADATRFARELESVLCSPRIRFHVKHVAIGVVRELARPSHADWLVVDRALAAGVPHAGRLSDALRTVGWFERLDAEGVILKWLNGVDEQLRSRALSIMSTAAHDAPDRLAALLRDHAEQPYFGEWIRSVTRSADLGASQPLDDLVVLSVRRGCWEGHERLLWVFADDMEVRAPDRACELVHAFLTERPSAGRISNGRRIDLTGRDARLAEFIRAGAAGAPQRFWALLGPWLIGTIAATAHGADDRPLRDRHFSWRTDEHHSDSIDDALLDGAVAALRALAGDARREADEVRALLEPLANDHHDASQWLLYQALCAAGPRLADWTADLLLEGSWRLHCGFLANPYLTTQRVLQVMTPHCSAERFAALESAVLGYRSPSEDARSFLAEFTLLSGLNMDRMSEPARRRLAELGRRYDTVPSGKSNVHSGFVQSPIPARALRVMSDQHLLRALTKHAHRERSVSRPLVGDAEQLANELRALVKEQPDRLAALALRPEFNLNPAYLKAVLSGLGEATEPLTPTLVFEVIRHAASLHDPAYEQELRAPLTRLFDAEIPDDIIDLLVDRALNACSPAPGAPPTIISSSCDGDDDDGPISTDPFTQGMNTARGSLALTLGNLLVHDVDGSRTSRAAPYLAALASDPSEAVRCCVAHVVSAALRHAEPTAIGAFRLLIDGRDQDPALATAPFERLAIQMA
jgi:hypothetical protein